MDEAKQTPKHFKELEKKMSAKDKKAKKLMEAEVMIYAFLKEKTSTTTTTTIMIIIIIIIHYIYDVHTTTTTYFFFSS
jgi:hypothetical protein